MTAAAHAESPTQLPGELPRESPSESQCDVLVIGGGPAGSTIAALLAGKGERVTLLEKDKHPRFHIGESLLPFNMPLFEQLGVMDEIKRIGMLKLGIELISPKHRKPVFLNFALGWDKSFSYAYQVRRSVFDHILLKNAAAKGANVIESCRVTAAEFPPEGGVVVRAQREDGQSADWRAKFLVDASGRDTFLASRMGIKHRDRRHNSAAIFGHFTGAKRLPGEAEGHITIFWFDEGWFWFIPLSDGTTSIGVEPRRTPPRRRPHDPALVRVPPRSPSKRRSSPPDTSRRRSRPWCGASRPASATRCCWASPAPARR